MAAGNIEMGDLWDQNCQLIKNPVAREWFRGYDCDTAGMEPVRKL